MQLKIEIIIIGGGVGGLATAYYLSRTGNYKILVLEKENQMGRHASGKNAGMLRQGVSHGELIPFIQETRRILQNPPVDWIHQNVFSQTGSVLIGNSELLRPISKSLAAHEIEFGISESAESFPSHLKNILKEHPVANFLYTPSDGIIDSNLLLENLRSGAEKRGVVFHANSFVKKIEDQNGEWVVSCPTEKFSAPILINAAGAWAGEVGKLCGSKYQSLNSYRRHLYQFSSEDFSKSASWPFVWDIQNEFYFRPRHDGWLLSAGDEELHPPAEPQVDKRIEQLLFEKKNYLFSSLKIGLLQNTWSCLRTKSANGIFFVDWDSEKKGLFWVAGLGGHGISVSLAVGKLAANKILQRNF